MFKVLQDLKIINDKTQDNIITNLYKRPKEDKKKLAHINVPKKGYVYQADLLFLPEDSGYKYALVVVDLATHNMDAEPIKDKSADTVLNAFKEIFKRKHLKLPKFSIEVDDGKEFKGPVKKYFNDNDVIIRAGRPNRHRQQGVVEWMNYILGKIIFMMMTVDEIHTGEVSKDWVEELPELVDSINTHFTITPHEPKIRDIEEDILPVGTLVRYALDSPQNVVDGRRLVGEFRAGDIRWSIKPVKITEVMLRPDQPAMYGVEGNKTNAYTRGQLQVYNKDEVKPEPRKYIVEKIVGKRKVNNKIEYHVKWLGYPADQNTWEPRAQLIKDVPQMVDAYEKS